MTIDFIKREKVVILPQGCGVLEHQQLALLGDAGAIAEWMVRHPGLRRSFSGVAHDFSNDGPFQTQEWAVLWSIGWAASRVTQWE